MLQNLDAAKLQQTMQDNGLVMSTSPDRTVFTGEQTGLTEGVYSPVMKGGTLSNEQVGRSGNKYNAIAFLDAKGRILNVGISSFANPIMILQSETADTKWDGKAKARSFFRFGATHKLFTQNADPKSVRSVVINGAAHKVYDMPNLALTKKVQYIVPEFEDGVNAQGQPVRRPVYKAGCQIRNVWATADYAENPGYGTNTEIGE